MLIIDAMMLMRRCHAKMDFLKTNAGVQTGLEYGTLRTIESLQTHYPGQRVVLCYESPDGTSWRKTQCPEYKKHRNEHRPDTSFFVRAKTFRRFAESFYWSADAVGWEADDVMYVLSKTSTGPHFIYTNDDDLLQCIDDERSVVVVKSFQSKLYEWDATKVVDKYGVAPQRLAVLRAFLGDGSDELPGCGGRYDKRYLSVLIEWAAKVGLKADAALNELLNAPDWKDTERALLNEHVMSGAWAKNYDMMRLRDVEVNVVAPKRNDDFVVECLKRWEIRSLKLCELYRERLIKDVGTEEF